MFTKETTSLKHNAGMDKADIERGYEVLEVTDDQVFGKAQRNPTAQGWRDAPFKMMHTVSPDYSD